MTNASARFILVLAMLFGGVLLARTDAIEGFLAGTLLAFGCVVLAAPRQLSGPLAACGLVLGAMYGLAAAAGFQPQIDPEDVSAVTRGGLGAAGIACFVVAGAGLVVRLGLRDRIS